MTEEKVTDILRKRAEKLARPVEKEVDDVLIEAVIFKLGEETYAVETRFVDEVYPIEQATALPGTPEFVHGMINVRRRVVSVIDLGIIFGLPVREKKQQIMGIILGNQHKQFALAVEEIVGVRKIRSESTAHSLPTLSGLRKEFFKGLDNQTILLDGDKILMSEELVVHEEV